MQMKRHSLGEIDGLYLCAMCKEHLPEEYFYKSHNGKPRNYCKECNKVKGILWNKAHPKPQKPKRDNTGSNNPNWRGGKLAVVCDYCGKSYLLNPYRALRDGKKFCSTACHSAFQKTVTGESASNWRGGGATKICPHCEKPFTVKEAVANDAKYCSKKCLNESKRYTFRGENNHQWMGGITPDRAQFYKTQDWYDAIISVRNRDGSTCQRCWKKQTSQESFHIHHIISFKVKKLRANPSNLVLLCQECHNFVHSRRNKLREFIGDGEICKARNLVSLRAS